MNFKVDEKPATKVLEIGRTLIGNEVIIDNDLYFFVPRSNGIHVFRMGISGRSCSFVTVHGNIDAIETAKEYLYLLKTKMIPSFIKKYVNIEPSYN